MAAAIKTRFLIMYWPSSEGTQGNEMKVTSGRIISGRKVPTIWNAIKINPVFTKGL